MTADPTPTPEPIEPAEFPCPNCGQGIILRGHFLHPDRPEAVRLLRTIAAYDIGDNVADDPAVFDWYRGIVTAARRIVDATPPPAAPPALDVERLRASVEVAFEEAKEWQPNPIHSSMNMPVWPFDKFTDALAAEYARLTEAAEPTDDEGVPV